MSRPSLAIGLAAAALVAVTTATPASAMRNDKLTYLTFTAPVQIPGVTLGAGTYRFRLADPDSGRKVMQVASEDGKYVYAMLHTLPDYRRTITDESTVTFIEAPLGVAPPVKSLFYGGETYGYAFLYGRGEPNLTPPPVKPQPEITWAPMAEASPVVAAASPSGAVGTTEPAAVNEPVAGATEPLAAETEAPLPATASPVPLIALGGIASLVLGLGVGLLRRRNA